MNFGIGFICGLLHGRNHSPYVEVNPSSKALKRREDCYRVIKENKDITTNEVAKTLGLSIQEVNATLTVLLKQGRIKREKKDIQGMFQWVYFA